jgi:hypothetical protein
MDWLSRFIGTLIGAGLQKLFLFSFHVNRDNVKVKKTDVIKQAETTRASDCRDVVMAFANHLGYIARECMSREELEAKIDSGISSEALARELNERIAARPGIILGTQTYQNHEIKLPYSYRSRHACLIGRSGSGKTNTIRQMVMQDIENGCGVGVLAPEQELLIDEILPYIPDERIDDVVYVNPADIEFPIPINPLHLEEGSDIDQSVDDLITIFSRLSNDITPRMREILYHTFYALLERKGSTLLDVEILLDRTDTSLRNEIISTTDNPRTARFFNTVFPSLARDACLPIYSRIGQLISPKRIRTLLCQPGKSFNFRDALDEGKILLFNVSDGILGEQTAQLLGQLIVSKIQMAVMSRADVPPAARRPFYFYLDEFPAFTGVADASYAKLLSRSRKYSFGMVLAMQQTQQIPNHLLQELLGNVSTLLTFNVSSTDAGKLCKEFVVALGNEADHIPDDFLLTLKVGQAWGKIGSTVFPLQTPLADQRPNPIRVKEIVERSRLLYGLRARREDIRPLQISPVQRPFVIVPDEDALDPAKVF